MASRTLERRGSPSSSIARWSKSAYRAIAARAARFRFRRAFRRIVTTQLRDLVRTRRSRRTGPVILVASTKVAAKQVALAHFCTALALRGGAQILAFAAERSIPRDGHRSKPGRGVPEALRLSAQFADRSAVLRPSGQQRQRAGEIVADFLRDPSPQALERYEVDGVLIGDLVYDEYLNIGHVTVDFADRVLRELLELMTRDVLLLLELMARENVVAVVGQHLAFRKGVPLRVAVERGVAAYCIAYPGSHKLDKENPRPHEEWRHDPETVSALTPEEQSQARARAQEYIAENILGGGHRHAPDLSGRGAWRKTVDAEASPSRNDPRSRRDHDTKRILVAVHSFTDSPHVKGSGLFPDYYLWVEHLAGLAERTDYQWLVKPHPDQRDNLFGATERLQEVIAPVPNMQLLDPSVSHRQLLGDGLDLVLTMYGTIGFEMPLFGVPAITALPNNPHQRFSYCLHPQSVEDYDRLLLDPTRWNYPIDRDEILTYAYLRYLHLETPVAIQEVAKRRLSGNHKEGGAYFQEWLRQVNASDTKAILADYSAWIDDGSYSHREFLARRRPR